MSPRPALLLTLAAGCQPLTDPCYAWSEDAPDRCVGEIRVDPAQDPVTFDVEGLGAADPTMLHVGLVDGEDPCAGSLGIWELKRFDASDLPLTYGVAPRDAKVWVNPVVSPDGTTIPLEAGRTYVAELYAKDRLSGSGAAPSTWAAVFVAGDPDSAILMDDLCR